MEPASAADSPIGSVFRRMAAQAAPEQPFTFTMGPERVSGTFNLTQQEDADEMIRRITALKAFLKPAETKPS